MFLSANQMEATSRRSARALGRCVGALMKVEERFPTPDRMEIQIVAKQVKYCFNNFRSRFFTPLIFIMAIYLEESNLRVLKLSKKFCDFLFAY